MAQWISLSEAAFQYGVNEEDIRFWIENREITFVPIGTTFVVDDESIQSLLSQHQVIPTKEYIATLKNMYENQFLLNQSCQEVIYLKELEIIKLEEEIELRRKVEEAMEKNIELYKTLNRLKDNSTIKFGWVERFKKKVKQE